MFYNYLIFNMVTLSLRILLKYFVSPRKTRIVPLKMKKNSEGIYDISVSKNEVIKPYQY